MANSATYILLLHLSADSTFDIGLLGECDFPGGFYAYIGAINSQAQLVSQLKKHLQPSKSIQNDVDHIQQFMQLEEIWLSANQMPSRTDWIDVLLDVPGSMSLIEGFGGADVDSDWDSYLLYFDVRPMLEDFAVSFRQLFPNDTVVRAFMRADEDQPDNNQDALT
ncbi:MAG: DUF123 domain-containing protein [Chloroflexota bacterium]